MSAGAEVLAVSGAHLQCTGHTETAAVRVPGVRPCAQAAQRDYAPDQGQAQCSADSQQPK